MPPVVLPWFVAVALPGWTHSRATLGRMATWCQRFTPRVHVEEAAPDVADGAPLVLLDASGCQRANGGAPRLAARLSRGLARRGIVHALGVGASGGEAVVRATGAAFALPAPDAVSGALPGAASWALGGARGAPGAPPHAGLASVDALPVQALRLPGALCAALREVNLLRIGEVRAVARSSLVDRYGPAVPERLDMAAGLRAWPFRAVPPPERVVGEFAFASPCAQREAVDRACRHAVDSLCAELAARGRGVRVLSVRIERARLAPVAGTLHLGAPAGDAVHLWSLLAPRLERVHLGHHEQGEGIERIALEAVRLGRLPSGTPLLAGAVGAAAAEANAGRRADGIACDGGGDRRAHTIRAVGELVDQLRARLGEQGARRPEP